MCGALVGFVTAEVEPIAARTEPVGASRNFNRDQLSRPAGMTARDLEKLPGRVQKAIEDLCYSTNPTSA
jgi:hypothetical protein